MAARYRKIIGDVMPFGKNDALEINIISAVMRAAGCIEWPVISVTDFFLLDICLLQKLRRRVRCEVERTRPPV